MASRNSTRSSSARSSHETESAGGQEAVAQFSRQQLSLLGQGTAALFRGTELLQRAQLHLTQRSGALYQETMDRLQRARSPAELLTIQAGVLMSGWQQAVMFSQDLMSMAPTAQSELEEATEEATNAATTAMDAFAPMAQAWQSFVTGSLNAANQSRPH